MLDARLILLTAVLLLPLVPAFILYKTLPSKATITGPFKGLNIRLTGAFGGYFILVLASIWFLSPEAGPTFEEREIVGSIVLEGADPQDTDRSQLRVSLHPTRFEAFPSIGNTIRYTLRVPVKRFADGRLEQLFGFLHFEYPGFYAGFVGFDGLDFAGGASSIDVGATTLHMIETDEEAADPPPAVVRVESP